MFMFNLMWLILQIERTEDVRSGTAVSRRRASRPQPVCPGAPFVHFDARRELLLGRRRAPRLRRLRSHGLRGYYAFRRGAGEPAASGEQLFGEGASAASSLMSEHRADCVLCAATASDRQRRRQQQRTSLALPSFLLAFFQSFLVIVISGLSPHLLHCKQKSNVSKCDKM